MNLKAVDANANHGRQPRCCLVKWAGFECNDGLSHLRDRSNEESDVMAVVRMAGRYIQNL